MSTNESPVSGLIWTNERAPLCQTVAVAESDQRKGQSRGQRKASIYDRDLLFGTNLARGETQREGGETLIETWIIN